MRTIGNSQICADNLDHQLAGFINTLIKIADNTNAIFVLSTSFFLKKIKKNSKTVITKTPLKRNPKPPSLVSKLINNSSLLNVKGILRISGKLACLKSLFVLEKREIAILSALFLFNSKFGIFWLIISIFFLQQKDTKHHTPFLNW